MRHFYNKSFLSKTKIKRKYNNENSTKFTFNVTSIRYSREIKNKIIKVEYLIGFYDLNKNLIAPSDFTLYYNYHVLCYNKNIKSNIFINSLANIYKNKNYYCTEFFNSNDNIIFGIILYKISNRIEYYSLDFFTYKYKIYRNYIYNIKNVFNLSLINEKFNFLSKKIHSNKLSKSLRLKKSFIQKPLFSTKNNIGKNNIWIFRNIFNHYFCFCKGKNCLFYNIPTKCKYYFYLSIIDNSKHLYKKTEYLFGDFLYGNHSTDDVYPIFCKMMSQNYGVHYITKIKNIYEKYCKNKSFCLTIIKDTFINGDFLENYLTLILKLKAVLSGSEFYFIDNLFYNIDYITYICVGHGVSFFKHFLYSENNYYGSKRYDKILIPPSKKLISVAKYYGWKEENIIKMNLPRWDNYNIKKKVSTKKKNIFVMFTWRQMKKKKNISELYFENINKLLNNIILLKSLKKYKISLYFIFHRNIESISRIKLNKYIKYVKEEEISYILSNTSLIVSDFSSIIFDIIYQERPFIIFIPDSNDPNINNIYESCYSDLIKDIKNGTISFQNTFFNIEDTVKKIIYYIKNNFNLESKMKRFYKQFGFKKKNSTNNNISFKDIMV
jgi:CDP-glycerol glycerophosphotransferase (TagB/SpsB family)